MPEVLMIKDWYKDYLEKTVKGKDPDYPDHKLKF